MTQIGKFVRTPDGYSGRIRTLALDAELRLVPAEVDAERAPDYRIHLGADGEGPEVGAGWKHTGERAGPFVSVVIDDPNFAQPIRASLFQSGRDDGASICAGLARPAAGKRSDAVRPLRPSWRFGAGVAAVLATVAFADIRPAIAADPPVAPASAAERIAQFVASAANRFGIPEAWIYAVMRAESAGDQHAVSHAGAMGLMQIMPATWAYLRARYALGADPFDAQDNITAGAAWLRELHDRYGSPGFLAAYNAGPARYDDHLATGRPLPPETRAYLAELAPIVGGKATLGPLLDPFAWTRAALFPGQSNGSETAPNPQAEAPATRVQTGLFIPLSGQAPRP